jgi:hypothetical protein
MNLRILALPLLWILTSACGVSPALHHHSADAAKKESSTQPPTSTECPFSFPKAGLCASWTWIDVPAVEVELSASVKFWNAKTGTPNGPYVAPSSAFRPYLWMPSMGHGSSPIRVTPQETGTFLLEGIFFSMPRDWTLNIELKLGNNELEKANIPIYFTGTQSST